jgi:hypothetical protein
MSRKFLGITNSHYLLKLKGKEKVKGPVRMQSALRVAACNPGQLPYVTMENGTLKGYDIGEEGIDCCGERAVQAKIHVHC